MPEMINDKLREQTVMFGNRLAKRAQYFRKWAKKQGVSAYRIYDRDIPEIPLSVDYYGFIDSNDNPNGVYIYISMYERPYQKDPIEEAHWLDCMKIEAARVMDIKTENVIIRRRRRQQGKDQYERYNRRSESICGIVREGSLRFLVNLSDYVDTGLFLDHRPLRQMLIKEAKGKRALNLFGYTGALSSACAAGGAEYVQTVDLSNTYLHWAQQNLDLNGFGNDKRFSMIRADVMAYLQILKNKIEQNKMPPFDIILLDPPTFSNSSMTENVLDTNRDWPELASMSLSCLAPGGVLYFSTNSRRLSFKSDLLPAAVRGHEVVIADITDRTLPEDFKNHRIHRCWRIGVEHA